MASFAELDDDDEAPPARAKLSDLNDDEAPASKASTAAIKAAPKEDLPWYKRAAQGFGDPLAGTGQLLQNILPDAAADALRKPGIEGALPPLTLASQALRSVSGGQPASTEDVNRTVEQREAGYQGERKAAGQEGLDWWRVGGSVANPMSWAGAGPAASAGGALLKGAGSGAIQALMQPVTDGDFAINKLTQTAIGAGAGGVLGAAFHGIGRGIAEAVKSFKDKGPVAAAEVADTVLRDAGADPAKVNPSVYAAIKEEVGDALSADVKPDPRVMFNRADAASLPVPIQLTRGQATRDPMQYSWEVNTSKLRGAGEPLTEMINRQNRELIDNLNVLGAKDAPSTFDASQKIISHLEGVDAQLKSKVDDAYKLVRDSAGRPALMDQAAFQQRAREGLEYRQLTEFVPDAIKKQYNALAQGQLPLSVDIAQTLDRVWSAEQRAATGSAKEAIGELRRALNEAPVTDQLGESAMQAYKAARQLAKQRFDLIDANPALKAAAEGVEPDKFFQKYVQGADVSDLAGLRKIIGPENTQMLQSTLTGNLKKIALNRASDENGVFSQAAYNKVLQDPVQGPRLKEIFADNPQTLEQLYRLGRVAENVIAFPKGHSVNTSNTAPTTANIIRDVAKSEAGASLANIIPGARAIREVAAQRAASKAVESAVKPGVTALPLKPATPPAQIGRMSELLSVAGAGVAAREGSTKREKRAND